MSRGAKVVVVVGVAVEVAVAEVQEGDVIRWIGRRVKMG